MFGDAGSRGPSHPSTAGVYIGGPGTCQEQNSVTSASASRGRKSANWRPGAFAPGSPGDSLYLWLARPHGVWWEDQHSSGRNGVIGAEVRIQPHYLVPALAVSESNGGNLAHRLTPLGNLVFHPRRCRHGADRTVRDSRDWRQLARR